MNTLENKKADLKIWITEYVNKFEEKGLDVEVIKYKNLLTAIDFSVSETSVNIVTHLHKIREEIQQHINNDNFDSKYKKLLDKLNYQMEKMIDKIYMVDYAYLSATYRLHIFKTDAKHIENNFNERVA